MANANELKNLIEPHVRVKIANKYHTLLEEKELPLKLITGGQHKFDIVSKDRTIVGGVKANSLRKNGRVGVGVIKSVYTELYFLSLIKAEKKLLILTDKGFYSFFKRISTGKVLSDIEIIYCELSESLRNKVAEIHKTASEEIGKN